MRGRRGRAATLSLALGAVVLAGCDAGSVGAQSSAGSTQRPAPPTERSSVQTGASSSPATAVNSPGSLSPSRSGLASTLLASIAIKGRAPKTGYSRDQFGAAWTDDTNSPGGHNGCDTRNDILRRDLSERVLKPDSNGCAVLTGVLRDPYTAQTILFRRGETTSTAVQIDHVVALGDAWQTGAQLFGAQTRVDLANDPLNLLAVDGSANESKGDGDSATWLPPNRAYRCRYVARQVAVKARYGLWVTPAEHDATARVLAGCPDQAVPAETGAAHITTVSPRSPSSPSVRSGGSVYYENCAAARAAGAAPMHRGEPGYRAGLDGDGDGVACDS